MNKTLESSMHGISSNVNLCRFLCAALVILCHAYPLTNNSTDAMLRFTNGQCSFGGLAVAVLFFFSGLYVTKSMTRRSGVGEYIKARCIRIFPPLILVVLLCVFIVGPICTNLSVGSYFGNASTYIYLLNGITIPVHNLPGVFTSSVYAPTVNGSLWTMSIEFACYIALLVFYKIYCKSGKKKGCLAVLAAVIVAGCVGIYILADRIPALSIFSAAVVPILAFFIGTAYYIGRNTVKLDWRLGLAGMIVLIVAGKFPFFNLVLLLIMPYVILCLTLGTKQILKNLKILELSYEMYLLGWPIQQILICNLNIGTSPWTNFLIALPIDILISWLVFQIAEKPFRKK